MIGSTTCWPNGKPVAPKATKTHTVAPPDAPLIEQVRAKVAAAAERMASYRKRVRHAKSTEEAHRLLKAAADASRTHDTLVEDLAFLSRQ